MIKIAAHRTDLPPVVDLIAAGADAAIEVKDGWTAVEAARMVDESVIVKKLLQMRKQ